MPSYRQLWNDIGMAARVLGRLPSYLRHPLTIPECRAVVARRLAGRVSSFLELARRAIFEQPDSPYRALLRHAGCEQEDLARLVHDEGIEGALRTLCRAGVYLTVDEFKGRRPAVRGSTSIDVDPDRLCNPLCVPHLWSSTGGSRGPATRVRLDLRCVRERAVNMFLALDARGGARWRNAVWGIRGISPLLWYSACGGPASRWFVQLDPAMRDTRQRFLWSARTLVWASRLARVPLPRPEYVSIERPQRIVDWLRQTLLKGEVPHLWGSPSAVVRLCEEAARTSVDLDGARFTITGEPVTSARLAAIRGVHGDAVPDYGAVDSGGTIAYGCLAPLAPDEVHVFSDLNAVIEADAPALPAGALLVSSLQDTAPFILVNVSMGDRATITQRRCGCAMEGLGWNTHLHGIRSFEKLTAGGMTFDDTDVIRVLEEVLPGRFGGGPTDYQLIEDTREDGHARLRLLVHPKLGPLDPTLLCDVFVRAVGGDDETRSDMAAQWRDGGFLRIDRTAPHRTETGKILHLIAAPASRSAGAP